MLKRALATLVICVFPTACGKQSDAIVSIAVHPTNPNILYVSTNERVYKTRDGGQSWEKFPDFSARRVTTVAVDPLLPATVYAGTMGDAVYKSPDGGQRWLLHNVGLKEHVSYVNQFVFHPDHTETIYAATTVGVFRTTKGLFRTKNQAESWEHIGQSLPDQFISSLVIHPTQNQVLYVGGRAGTQKSFDGGQTWRPMNKGLETLNIRAIVLSSLDPHTLYAGTNGRGLYRSKDGAQTWTRVQLVTGPTASGSTAS